MGSLQKNGTRQLVAVNAAGQQFEAWVYTTIEECGKRRDHGSYSNRCRKVCSDGAEYWGIPNAFSDALDTGYTLWNR